MGCPRRREGGPSVGGTTDLSEAQGTGSSTHTGRSTGPGAAADGGATAAEPRLLEWDRLCPEAGSCRPPGLPSRPSPLPSRNPLPLGREGLGSIALTWHLCPGQGLLWKPKSQRKHLAFLLPVPAVPETSVDWLVQHGGEGQPEGQGITGTETHEARNSAVCASPERVFTLSAPLLPERLDGRAGGAWPRTVAPDPRACFGRWVVHRESRWRGSEPSCAHPAPSPGETPPHPLPGRDARDL